MSHDSHQTQPNGAHIRLGDVARGFSGVVAAIDPTKGGSALDPLELERRLIEFGFVEGAVVEILHEGAIGRDPIAVRINNITIALRRREAMAVVVAAA
jgi:ferrous iron transport protein A